MRTLDPHLFRTWGWNTQGDFGPYTFYTKTNNALTWYLKAPPRKPPTQHQRHQRAKLTTAARLWSAQPAERQARWERATRAANLRITGYNLWIYHQLTADRPAIRTIERQTAIPLLT